MLAVDETEGFGRARRETILTISRPECRDIDSAVINSAMIRPHGGLLCYVSIHIGEAMHSVASDALHQSTMIPVLLLPMVSLAFLAAVVRALAASAHLGGSAHIATCTSRRAMIFMMKLPMFLLVCPATVMRLFTTVAALVESHFPAQGTLYTHDDSLESYHWTVA